ncbi:EsaB/YukD family protein [Streptomyces liangshanensis]|uniref:EccD-like transmembrane domain-containing protein n=1 Tax=Streptomyces liangshanensis TaxID=2717324 RepID=A0A6G9GZ67_9ACTN|nr:EsaB/YukD family protein [Streptomyces liangshanensis]QIQ03510.1 hypothetical protein HA039_15275 [Streptomyces liangshanensis]
MDDERCRITVVGSRRRVDLAVPARTAIAEYTPGLLRLCGQDEEDDTFPAAWSLALPGARPLSPGVSLSEAGVADGATLYLRDAAAGEFDGPEITDLDELVGEANQDGLHWDTRQHALTVLFLGLGGMVAALAVFVGLTAGDAVYQAAGLGAVVGGLGLAVLAGHATRRAWPLALPVRLGLALAAVPLVAVGAVLLVPSSRDSSTAVIVATASGVLAGALAARLAVNHALTLTTLVVAAVVLPTAGLLAGFGATLVESAGVVAVLAMGALAVLPVTAGHLVALSAPSDAREGVSGASVPGLVALGRRVLAGLTQVLSAVLVAALVVLGTAADAYALILTLVVSGVLLLRSGQLKITAAVLPMAAAGFAGLATVLLHAPGALGAPDWSGPLAGLVAGAVLLGTGVVRALPAAEQIRERPSWFSGLSSALALTAVPLAVGLFGVFGTLMNMGELM